MRSVDEIALKGVLLSLGIAEACIASALPVLLGRSASPPAQSQGLLNLKQARTFLGGVSRWTIMRAVESGKLRCTRIGRRVMFAADDLNGFVRSLRVRNY